MGKLFIEFETNNSFFEEDLEGSCAELLQKFSEKCNSHRNLNLPIRDINGNTVGRSIYFNTEPKNLLLDIDETSFLKKWMGKIVDRGDLLEEVEEDGEYQTALALFKQIERL